MPLDHRKLACQTQAEYDGAWADAASRPAPDSFDRALRHGKEFADACQRESAALLPFVGTEYVARDMDLLRQAVGDAKLNYLGFSYGTYIGTVYANLFPRNVRVAALDGAYNPVTNANRPYEYDLGQFKAAGSPPILVVGNTGDPDTPYQDSVALAKILRNGHLLTHRGEGHTGFYESDKCIPEKITAYLVEGALPAQGAFCED